jgi:hypothetical protein
MINHYHCSCWFAVLVNLEEPLFFVKLQFNLFRKRQLTYIFNISFKNMDMMIYGGAPLPPELLKLALEVKSTMTAIQKAGAGKEVDDE